MALSQTVIRELRQELDRLQQTRQRLDERISGIQVVLSADSSRLGGGKPPETRGASTRRPQESRGHQGSLREAILGILRSTPALDVGGVTQRLRDTGFQVGGTTSLRDRAGNELRRLRIVGVLKKEGRKKYRLLTPPVADQTINDAAPEADTGGGAN